MPNGSRSTIAAKQKKGGSPMTFLLQVLAEALVSELTAALVAIVLA
jgi:hypothetical protein